MLAVVGVGVERAVDLCAAPGSWSQVLATCLKPRRSDVPDSGEEASPVGTHALA